MRVDPYSFCGNSAAAVREYFVDLGEKKGNMVVSCSLDELIAFLNSIGNLPKTARVYSGSKGDDLACVAAVSSRSGRLCKLSDKYADKP